MRVENGILALEFDERTGSLVQIIDRRNGRCHLSHPTDGRLFRLFVPDEEQWIDRYCDSHEAEPPRFVATPEALEIRFSRLRAGDGTPTAITATVHVALKEGADEALLSLSLENGDPHVVCETLFPWLGGWTGYEDPRHSRIRCGSVPPLDPFHLRKTGGWNLLHSHRRHTFAWPHLHAPLCDLSGTGAGLSLNLYPTRQDRFHELSIVDLAEHRYEASRPSFCWVQRPFLGPGDRWTSDPVGIGTHGGDWHVTADRMRRWLRTWWQPPYLPERLRHAIGFHNAFFQDFTGRQWRPLSALPALARHGLEHGLDHFCLWDMPFMGLYMKAGTSGLLEMAPERLGELREALSQARDLGVETSALVNLRLVEQKNSGWRQWGEDRAVRSRYGMPIRESFPWRACTANLVAPYLESGGTRLCQAYPAFQDWAVQQVEAALDLGLGTVFMDQPFSEDYCFATHHGHAVGAPLHAGACAWVKRGGQAITRRHSEAWVMGEVPDIWNTQVCNVWWHWDWNALQPEVFRYLLPASVQSWTIDACEHEHEVGRAFALGHLLNLNVRSFELALPDAPALATRVKQLAALRRKTAAFTVDGRFLDDQGFRLETQAVVHAYRYQGPRGSGIVLGEGSIDNHSGAGVRLELSGSLLEGMTRKQAILHRQDGSEQVIPLRPSSAGAAVEFILNRWEGAVLQL